MSQYDFKSIHEFVLHTPEQGLRKMLVDGKSFTDIHFQLLLKVARACDANQFDTHAANADFPKVKFGPAEMKIKENFWKDSTACFNSRGLLSPAAKAA